MFFSSSSVKLIESKLVPLAAVIGRQRHLVAMRDGFISAMPFMIVGSFILILAHPPFTANTTLVFGQKWLQFSFENKASIMMPFHMTMGMMSVYIATGIGYNLASSFRLNPLIGAMLSLFSFLIVAAPVEFNTIPETYLGGGGIFTAVLTSIYTIELMHFLVGRKWVIRLFERAPDKIAHSFMLLIPISAIVVTLYPFSLWIKNSTGMLLPEIIMSLFSGLIAASDTLAAILICVTLSQLLWFCGIHGAAILASLLQPFWLANLSANQMALQLGLTLPHTFVEPFWRFYIFIGGCGSTFVLVLMYLRSRSAHLRTIGRLSIIPSFFNINEPVIFGSPLVMNPLMFVPFIGVPLINATIAWFALTSGLVDRPISLVPWTTPAPIGAAWSAGWSIRPVLLVSVNLVVSFILWLPFYRMYEKQLLQEEHLS